MCSGNILMMMMIIIITIIIFFYTSYVFISRAVPIYWLLLLLLLLIHFSLHHVSIYHVQCPYTDYYYYYIFLYIMCLYITCSAHILIIIIIIIIIIFTSQLLDLDRPVSPPSITLPSHLSPLGLQLSSISAILLLSVLVTWRSEFDLCLLSFWSTGSAYGSYEIYSFLLLSKRVTTERRRKFGRAESGTSWRYDNKQQEIIFKL